MPTWVKYTIPCQVYLASSSLELLDFSAKFKFEGYEIQFSFPGGPGLEIPELPQHNKFIRLASGIQIIVCDEDSSSDTLSLSHLVKDEPSDLLQLIRNIWSRICRVIRNFAMVPEIPEKLAEKKIEISDVESHLRKWMLQTSSDGKDWLLLFPPRQISPFEAILFPVQNREEELAETIEIQFRNWSYVVEALEDGEEPQPEQEFFTNTIGHLRRLNFRLAVLESIICLEIVLTQFLKQYLTLSAKLPSKHVKEFLSPALGLSTRISVLLKLALHTSWLDGIDLDKVLKVVGWRNDIVHKIGNLPADLKENVIKEHVSIVLKLCRVLAERRDNINAGPAIEDISEALHNKFKILMLNIQLKRGHRVRIDMTLFPTFDIGDWQKLFEPVSKEIIELLQRRDARFKASQHLTIRFSKLPDITVGWFSNGSITITDNIVSA